MYSPNQESNRSSPTYKHLKMKNGQSPIEIKEKLRKSYREKVQSSRYALLNSFRGALAENNVHKQLDDIYKSMFNFNEEDFGEDDEKLIQEIREELVKEELNWWLEEYEKCQNDNIDWNSLEKDDIICPMCEKVNLIFINNKLSCSTCKITIRCDKSISEIRNIINNALEGHNLCNNEIQFTTISEDQARCHLYLICSRCNDMQIII